MRPIKRLMDFVTVLSLKQNKVQMIYHIISAAAFGTNARFNGRRFTFKIDAKQQQSG